MVIQLLSGSFQSIIGINKELRDFFQKDIFTLENRVVSLTDLNYANAAKLEQYKLDHEKYKQQLALYKQGFSVKGAITGGAIPLSRTIITQFETERLSPTAALAQLKKIYGKSAYKILYWQLSTNLTDLRAFKGLSADFINYIKLAARSGTPDWFEDEFGFRDIVVSLVPYKKGGSLTGVIALIFDISKAYNIIETADRLSLSIKSAKIQEQRLREGEKVTAHFRQRRQKQRKLVQTNAENNQSIITKSRNELILFIGANMTMLIGISVFLFWWLGSRRITKLRNWMVALTESNYMLQPSAADNFLPPSSINLTRDLTSGSSLSDNFSQHAVPPHSLARLEIKSMDEIAALSKSINVMLDSLDSTMVSKNLLLQENGERKLVEKRLRDNQERLKTIFDAVQAGVIIIEAESHKIVDANPAAQKMIGARRRQIIGKTCYRSICLQRLQECRMSQPGESIDNMEHLILTAAGHELPVIKTETAIMLDGKKHFICSFVDISALQMARLALEEAKRNAEQANRIKSQFLANMSHEIRTPLNGVLGMADIALHTRLDEEQRHIINTINTEAASLLRIINDILDFSKIEAGKLELEEISFNLHTICEEVVQTIIFAGEQKGLEIIFFISPDIPEKVKGDPGRIRQILKNLCGNALKFTHQGEIYIKIELWRDSTPANLVRFSIKDSGIGIAENKLASIFESFRQIDGSTTRTYGGTGLGTTISKQLVELMGGQIGVSSKVGVGSTFWFILPLPESDSDESLTNIEQINNHLLSGRRVLIVDDNQTNLFILEEYLNSWGCIPIKAADGNNALQILHAAENSIAAIDLIITDFSMPETDGFNLISQLRSSNSKGRDTPVIVLSSINSKADIESWDKLAIQGFLNKPILRQELKVCICKALGTFDYAKADKITREISTRSEVNRASNTGKILLVEDYPTNRKVASYYLSSAGYSIDEAEDGKQALTMVRDKKYGLIFMDIQMPIMDGYKATRKIREWEKDIGCQHGLPIIAMTAHALAGYREQCIEAGMNDYITKPLKRKEFVDMAEKWLSAGSILPPAKDQTSKAPSPLPVVEKSGSPIDIAGLLVEMDNDKEIIIELFDSFDNSLQGQKLTMRQAFEAKDYKLLERESHAVKGAALNVCANELAVTAKDLENSCRAGQAQNYRNLFISLNEKIEEVQVYMQEFVNRETA
ncbi:response regulator [Desulfobacterota bacterium M19]